MMTISTGIPFCPLHCPTAPLTFLVLLETLWVECGLSSELGLLLHYLIGEHFGGKPGQQLWYTGQKSWDLGNRKRFFRSPDPMPYKGRETEAQRGKETCLLPPCFPARPFFLDHLSQPETESSVGRGICIFFPNTWRISHLFRADGGKMNFLLN